MRLRNLIAALTALLVVLGLSACGQSKAGAAAVVGGHRITESDVAKYVSSSGPDPDVVAQAEASGAHVQPRVSALSLLIRVQLTEQTLRERGGVPSDDSLAGLRDTAFQTFLGIAPQQIGEFIASLPERLSGNGFSPAYRQLLERSLELDTALISRVNASSQADLDAAVRESKIAVSVSPRYGTWDAENLQLASSPSDGVPDFIRFVGAGQAAPSAASPDQPTG